MKALSRFKRGQAVIILTLVIPALIGAVALGTDVALFYYNWIKLQQATDAAVLGGASYLPSNPKLAVATARKLAAAHGIKPTEIAFTLVASNHMSMTMGVTRTLPHLLGRVLGLASGNVTAAATAGVATAHSVGGLVPIGIQYGTSFASYLPLTPRPAGQDGTAGPGNWQPLSMVPPASRFEAPSAGFAELWVQNIDHNGDINCEFIDKVSVDNEPGYGAPRYGALSVALMQ